MDSKPDGKTMANAIVYDEWSNFSHKEWEALGIDPLEFDPQIARVRGAQIEGSYGRQVERNLTSLLRARADANSVANPWSIFVAELDAGAIGMGYSVPKRCMAPWLQEIRK